MNAFTLAYLARTELWAFVITLAQGGLVAGSWYVWRHACVDPDTRHRLACAHFAALVLLPVLTLALLHATVAATALQPPAPGASWPSAMGAGSGVPGAALALAWGMGVLTMGLRLGLDLRALARVRHVHAPADLVDAVQRLARALGLAKAPDVRLADVASPQVIGWRSPRLLVPRAVARRLPEPELHAVLLHELAHVSRSDFRWNLLQRGVLALLWFHPAAWALSAGIARERERRCDALAVRHGASPTALARALVRLSEGSSRPVLGMAISRRSDLTARVHALLGRAAPAPRGARTVALALSGLCLAGLAAGRLAVADPALGAFYTASDIGPTIAIQARDEAGAFELQVRHGRVIEASSQDRPLDIVQEGSRVTLMSPTRATVVVLTVTPQGHVAWDPRR